MVLITSLCVVELYFFFMKFYKGAAEIVSWWFRGSKVCACAEQFFPDLHYLRRQNILINFIFYRNENQFFSWFTLMSHELE